LLCHLPANPNGHILTFLHPILLCRVTYSAPAGDDLWARLVQAGSPGRIEQAAYVTYWAQSLVWNVGNGFWNSGGTPSGEGDTEPLYWFRTIKKQCRTRLLVKFEGDDLWAAAMSFHMVLKSTPNSLPGPKIRSGEWNWWPIIVPFRLQVISLTPFSS
jgi:hypothetical protein